MAEHTENLDVCRICLAMDVRMKKIVDTPLQQVFERLTNIPLHTVDQRPMATCYMCYSLLHKSYELTMTAVRAEYVFTDILKTNEVTKTSLSQVDRHANKLCGTLAVSQTKYVDFDFDSSIAIVEVKVERETDWDNGSEIKEEPLDPMDFVSSELPDIEKIDIKQEHNEEFRDEEVYSDSGNGPGPSLQDFKQEDIAAETTPKKRKDPKSPIQKKPRKKGAEGTLRYAAQITEPEKRKVSKTTNEKQEPRNPTETNEGRHECHICQRRLPFACELKKHLRIHTNERPYHCNVCKLSFKLTSHLSRHLRSHTGEKPHECNFCQRRYTELGSLQRHIRTHTGEKPYTCDICQKSFSDHTIWKKHLRTHDKKSRYECDICQSQYSSKDKLVIHIRIHTGEKPYGCDSCELRFHCPNKYRRHLETHAGVEFKCDICQSKFARRVNLNAHLKIHSNERRYVCKVCNNGFNQYSSLKSHLYTHTGEKPYECDVCHRKFTQPSALKRHSKIHTGDA